MGTTKIEDLITYNPDTGEFKWLNIYNGRQQLGWFQPPKQKHCKTTYVRRGYIRIQTKRYLPHRLAWYLMKGYWPKVIDHINRDATDNRFLNLREVFSSSENNQNVDAKGYYFKKQTNKYYSCIMVNGVSKWLGYFDTAEEARATYLEAKKKYHAFYYDTEV